MNIAEAFDAVERAYAAGKLILWDFFCGVGGAGHGYKRAGFFVVGTDNRPQPNYAGDLFIQADFREVAEELIRRPYLADATHWSPPCQRFTTLAKGTNGNRDAHPDHVDTSRRLAKKIGRPYVIENVLNAPVRRDLILCGEMFKLRVLRHRAFELGEWSTWPREHEEHRGRVRGWNHGKYHHGYYFAIYGNGGGNADRGSAEEWSEAMEMPWAKTKDELREAIPPAYTEWIGARLIQWIRDLEYNL